MKNCLPPTKLKRLEGTPTKRSLNGEKTVQPKRSSLKSKSLRGSTLRKHNRHQLIPQPSTIPHALQTPFMIRISLKIKTIIRKTRVEAAITTKEDRDTETKTGHPTPEKKVRAPDAKTGCPPKIDATPETEIRPDETIIGKNLSRTSYAGEKGADSRSKSRPTI
ncbi:hypothetical protein F2Q68_00004045 [Brassica cretica]|uniref:Uncharacterized protein n=2 Tax=Brassica cretica TaxID=69181 RepID=A0ABQ7BT92_BRACR|nr:hypothetical protein F2Q68_00004045 [Brassica cretica]KAF3542493.1 hypothetical protein DY000_02005946 [Brassica cretica]